MVCILVGVAAPACTPLNGLRTDGGGDASVAPGVGGAAQGTGGAPQLDAPVSTSDTGGPSNGDGGGADRAPNPQAALSIAPNSKDFSLVVVNGTVDASFDVTNTGGMSSGVPTPSFSGPDASLFTVTSSSCAAALAAGAHCSIAVRFNPTSTGAKNATLTVSASPGGSATASLMGSGANPGALTLTPTQPPSLGSLVPGARGTPLPFTVTNSGDVSTSALAITLSNTTDFELASHCLPGALGAHSSCTVEVVFAPKTSGPKSATLAVSATQGGTASVGVSGTGLRNAALAASADVVALGSPEVGASSGFYTWTVTNQGDVPTSAISVANNDLSEINVSSDNCTGKTLAAGAACSVVLAFRPSVAGLRSGTISASATSGGQVTLTVSATGLIRITVITSGTGTVTSQPAGISCGSTCEWLFAPGSVTLQARTSNGSGYRFGGWSETATCPNVLRDCTFSATTSKTVNVTFVPVAANLVFVTHDTFPANLGGVAAYDARCNAAATAAGINDAGGTAYVSMTSSTTSAARARLGTTANGWVRMDGRPFADTQTALFTNNQVVNGISLDETGALAGIDPYVMTATKPDGTFEPTLGACGDWTSLAPTDVVAGVVSGGPSLWIGQYQAPCQIAHHLVCMGKTRSAAVAPIVSQGRRIWVTRNLYAVGAQTPNAACQSERPTGVTTAVALVSYTTQPASAQLTATSNYVRLDGTLVGTGAQISRGDLESGIWQVADGSYDTSNVSTWTGSSAPNLTGSAAETCGDWANPNLTGGLVGAPHSADSSWWYGGLGIPCNPTARFYCVQTAP